MADAVEAQEAATDEATGLLVKELLVVHPEYRRDLIEKHTDFYEGGDRFERNKDKYLRKREIEYSSLPIGKVIRRTRLETASYTPHVAGMIDWLVSACMQSEPAILADVVDKEHKTPQQESKIAFYHSLNVDCDGCGNDLVSVVRSRLLEAMVHHRSYFLINWPASDGMEYTDIGAQRDAGQLGACICKLNAIDVDDWDKEGDEYTMIRTHHVELARATRWGPRNIERHTWTYFTEDAIYEYQAEKLAGKEWEKGAVARLMRTQEIAAFPITRICIPKGMWVMNRLFPTAYSLFNRESSLDYALDTSAFALPVVMSKKSLGGVVANELAILQLDVGDDYKWATPPSGHFEALDKSSDTKKDDLASAIQAIALQSKDASAGRQSGAAKRFDNGMISTLLSSYAGALRDALERTLAKIQTARGDDDIILTITGLDKFDVQALELMLKEYQIFSGVKASETAKRYAAQKVALAVCADAPAPTKEEIRVESDKLEFDEPKATPEEPDETDTRQPDTEEVKGFSNSTVLANGK
ncbi:MAG TPA: hypothetical protein VGP72_16560 [Planctomycetota bacterium]|jgi:hypothetical protein